MVVQSAGKRASPKSMSLAGIRSNYYERHRIPSTLKHRSSSKEVSHSKCRSRKTGNEVRQTKEEVKVGGCRSVLLSLPSIFVPQHDWSWTLVLLHLKLVVTTGKSHDACTKTATFKAHSCSCHGPISTLKQRRGHYNSFCSLHCADHVELWCP